MRAAGNLTAGPVAADALGPVAAGAQPLVLAGDRRLEVVAPLAPLLPGGGLRRGSTVVVGPAAAGAPAPPGATSLAMALLAGPSAAGCWCAVVGAPHLGLVAAARMGVALERLALVPHPGDQWPAVAGALLDSVDVVWLHLPAAVRPASARLLVARARERGAVLVVSESRGRWPERADSRLAVAAAVPTGLGDGHGHLRARRVEVTATGRGAAAGGRRVAVWMPGPEGPVSDAGSGGAPVATGRKAG